MRTRDAAVRKTIVSTVIPWGRYGLSPHGLVQSTMLEGTPPPLPCLGPTLPNFKPVGQGAPTGGMHSFNGVSLSQMLKRLEKSECFALSGL